MNKELLDSKNPFIILKEWIQEAQKHPEISEPMAFSLSTVNSQNLPSSRVLLAKEITPTGFIFYTNENSQKGQCLKNNPQCAAHFYWDPLYKQINIQGESRQISKEKTFEYWKSRPRKKQIHQWVSQQSQEISNREFLNQQVLQAEIQFKGKDIPLPPYWRGYHLTIRQIEFWRGNLDRLHHRVLFHSPKNEKWKVKYLYP